MDETRRTPIADKASGDTSRARGVRQVALMPEVTVHLYGIRLIPAGQVALAGWISYYNEMKPEPKELTLTCTVDSYRSGWTVVDFLAHRFKYHTATSCLPLNS